MAMTRKLWSISGLATEFDLDRRTVASRIKHIPPAGKLRGHEAWSLIDVAPALTANSHHNGGRDAPPIPAELPGLRFTKKPFDAGAYIMATLISYKVGPMAASLAVGVGASMNVAYALKNAMTLAIIMEAEQIGRELGFEPYTSWSSSPIYNFDCFDENDWETLAAKAGEEVDLQEWKRWAKQHLKDVQEDV